MYLKILCFFICCSCFSQEQDLRTVSRNDDRPLTWDDFEAAPVKQSGAAALTASGITFGFSINKEDGRIVDFSTTVESLFYPEKSWVKPEHANAHILRHEQLHFDITELHARKFRKQIQQLKVSQNIRSQLNRLYKTTNEALTEMQKRYDAETNHSINKEKQAEWETFVIRELRKFEAYKSS